MLRALAGAHGSGDHVRFLGLVTRPLKLSLYEAADVFALPTHGENFGLVLPESLACGTPIVTTKGTDIWPELQAAGARLCTTDPASIADAIASLLADPPLARELGRRGREWVLSFLDPDRLAGEYERLYHRLSDRARKRRLAD
jgi:glycosyltransferase involved in cell wall biosynthesis